LVLAFSTQQVFAQKAKLSFIRDAEIEHTLRSYATPVFTAAGLNADDVSIHLINNKVINAFVAGGQRIFFFTGLLERIETPDQLKGVIAHETGHIAAGDLARTQNALKNATTKSILGYILGAAAVIVGGGNAGLVVAGGANTIAQKSFLKYSREQESAADQASIRFLNRLHTSGRGMVEFLKIIGESEKFSYGKIDPYWRTHPISYERVAALKNQVEKSPYKDVKDTPEEILALKKIQAKIYGYTKGLRRTLKKYPLEDQSEPARYARAIAYFKHPDIEKAMVEIDSLLAEFPDNPYYYEIKGQMLYENSDIQGALPALEVAVELAPDEPLILTLYGTVLLSTGAPEDDRLAISILRNSILYDRYNQSTWQQLAIAYSRIGDVGNLALASAERFLLQGQSKKAVFHAKRAQENMSAGSPGFLRADDIVFLANQQMKKK